MSPATSTLRIRIALDLAAIHDEYAGLIAGDEALAAARRALAKEFPAARLHLATVPSGGHIEVSHEGDGTPKQGPGDDRVEYRARVVVKAAIEMAVAAARYRA